MIFKCIIVEDEPLAQKKLQDFISNVDFLHVVSVFDSALEAISYLNTNQIDLIFLDIEMDKLSGIDFLKILPYKPNVIITSAYESYALDGYEYNVLDYLLKPFSFDRFLAAVQKLFSSNKPILNNDSTYVFVKTENRITKVLIRDILFVEGMKDYLRIVTTNSKIMTLMSFKKLLLFLPQNKFVRVHNSYVVAVDWIDNIVKNRVFIKDYKLPIGPIYKDKFFDIIKNKSL